MAQAQSALSATAGRECPKCPKHVRCEQLRRSCQNMSNSQNNLTGLKKAELSEGRSSFEQSRVKLQLICVAESIDHLATERAQRI